MSFLTYLFWPNPGNASYTSVKALILALLCVAFLVAAFVLSLWRKRMSDQRLRKLSRSWPSAAFWFGLVGLVLVVARVEQIQFIAMRVLWVFWIAALASYVFFQVRRFRAQYYQVVPATSISDPRSTYLPKKKRR